MAACRAPKTCTACATRTPALPTALCLTGVRGVRVLKHVVQVTKHASVAVGNNPKMVVVHVPIYKIPGRVKLNLAQLIASLPSGAHGLLAKQVAVVHIRCVRVP